MRNRSFALIMFLATLLCINWFGLWHMDVAVGAILSGGKLTNGWWTESPIQAFHYAMYLVMGSTFLLMSLSAYGIARHAS